MISLSAICKMHQSINCINIWYFKTKNFIILFLREKMVLLNIKWPINHWSIQRISFIHMKVLQDFLCVYWLVNKNSFWKVFNLQVKIKLYFTEIFHLEFILYMIGGFCELFRSFHNIYHNSSKLGFSFFNAWTSMDSS